MFPYKSVLFKLLNIVVKFNILLFFCCSLVEISFIVGISLAFFWKGIITSDVSGLDFLRSKFYFFIYFTCFWIRLLRKCGLSVSVTATISWFIESPVTAYSTFSMLFFSYISSKYVIFIYRQFLIKYIHWFLFRNFVLYYLWDQAALLSCYLYELSRLWPTTSVTCHVDDLLRLWPGLVLSGIWNLIRLVHYKCQNFTMLVH